jgi:hypothetical protein
MGYQTDFTGSVTVSPPLSAEEVAFINKFSETRRMHRKNGPYFVDGGGYAGQDHDSDIIDYNEPPPGQPGLWCKWEASEDGTEISWNGAEKFYDADEWMAYIIDHFIRHNPTAKLKHPEEFSFLRGHTVTGDIFATGEEPGDLWKIEVRDNDVMRVEGHINFGEDHKAEDPYRDMLALTRVHIRAAREQWDASPNPTISHEAFELFLRDLEEASGIR